MTIDEFIDVQLRNQRLSHYDIKVVAVPFEHPRMLVRGLQQQKAAIAVDRNLMNEGKTAALEKARGHRACRDHRVARASAEEQLMLTCSKQRAALIGNVERPDPKRVELMQSHLLKLAPSDVPIFYNSASETERREMEAASASVGRVPVVTASGKEWKTLLDPEMVNEAILTRAGATNPTATQKVRELVEIKAMQTTITGVRCRRSDSVEG